MQLRILDRMVLMQILPKTTQLVNLKILADLHDALGFTEDEIEKYTLTVEPQWDNEDEVEVKIGQIAEGIIKQALKDADREGKLHVAWLPTLAKFGMEPD